MEKVAKRLTCENAHLVYTRKSDNVATTECKIIGAIPSWLNGQLIRNGPGEFDVGKDTFKHLFDGHALIHKYDISDGSVSYMSKFVLSEDYKKNHEKERIIIGSFGTSSIPDPCKNIFSRFFTKFFSRPPVSQNASVNVTSLGNTYYAITDAAWCEKINSESLEAEEHINLTDLFGMTLSTAHPHFDVNGDFYNLATHAGKNGYYAIYRVPFGDMNSSNPMKDLQIHSKVAIDTPLKPCYYHSFALSENYITIHDHPVRIDAFKIMKSTFTWDAAISAFDHQVRRESVFHVVDKNKQMPHPVRYCSKGRFTFHHINSYERTVNEKKFLIVDLLCADGPTFFYFWIEMLRSEEPIEKLREPPTMWPYRFVLPLVVDTQAPKGENLVKISGCQASAILREDGSVFLTPERLIDEETIEKFHLFGVEFPVTNYKEYNTKSYKYLYCVGQEGYKSFDSLCKVNVETKEVLHWKEEGYFPSEPIFVKNPRGVDEDDGVILSSVINVNPNDPIFLLVLDAKTFTEIGRAEIMANLTVSFHGGFFGSSKLQQS